MYNVLLTCVYALSVWRKVVRFYGEHSTLTSDDHFIYLFISFRVCKCRRRLVLWSIWSALLSHRRDSNQYLTMQLEPFSSLRRSPKRRREVALSCKLSLCLLHSKYCELPRKDTSYTCKLMNPNLFVEDYISNLLLGIIVVVIVWFFSFCNTPSQRQQYVTI